MTTIDLINSYPELDDTIATAAALWHADFTTQTVRGCIEEGLQHLVSKGYFKPEYVDSTINQIIDSFEQI